MPRWLGVDVGGERKGHHVAVIDGHRLRALGGGLRRDEVVELVTAQRPVLVGIDSPRSCAPEGQTARADELLVNRLVCGIRWTPDAATVSRGRYYAWVRAGLLLFEAVVAAGAEAIEVFPTASWTLWCGARGGVTRSRWTGQGLARLGLDGVPGRTNQDERDAIAAAVTAWQHTRGLTHRLGEIVVPAGRWVDW